MKLFNFLAILIVLSIVSGTSYSQQKMSVFISNHTFSSKSSEVGTLHTNSAEKVAFKVRGKNAKIFVMQDNKLLIVAKYIKPDVKFKRKLVPLKYHKALEL